MSGSNHVKAESHPRSPVRERINDFSHGAGDAMRGKTGGWSDLGPWTLGPRWMSLGLADTLTQWTIGMQRG